MTLAARDTGNPRPDRLREPAARGRRPEDRPVEFWPTSAIRSALHKGDITVWQRIVVAIKRDPYGRTARQVEEVLSHREPVGVSKALDEVIVRSREHLEANERAEAARHIRMLLDRSGLSEQEFASRIGVPAEDFKVYLSGETSPPASLMIRMRRLSDRFAKNRSPRSGG
ncbi:XRE family transcriptional regulator [[Mycobacterium] wendilense]|uniref:XRE family transcriptional regulator n=1 Tax=[Mycobacterium] wendilense TaxID=3064284 RepID=UPI0037CBFBF2